MNLKLITACLCICLLTSCGTDGTSVRLTDLDKVNDKEGFIDLPLSVVDEKKMDGYVQYRVRALAKTDTLELLVSLKEDVPPGFVDGQPKNMFLSDGIIFESTGARSNQLLNLMNEKYGFPKADLSLKSKQVFTAANLNQDKVNHNRGNARFKIFLEEEEDYAELFVNFDFTRKKIYLNEKDPGYREGLITLMSK
jgi:hypothetical protein